MLEELLLMILRGVLIGVVVSAPMGPVGIFCIQRTLDKGRLSGFYTGIGAAVSDLIYCLLTGFCLSFIEEFINTNRGPIQFLGACVLIAFGIWLIKKKPSEKGVRADDDTAAPSREGDILKGFALTFSNPLILFLIIGLFAQFNFVIEDMKFYHYVLGFIGIAAGAVGWWWTVTFFVDKLRGHFNKRTMKLINTCVGVIILIFAAVGIFGSVSLIASAGERGVGAAPSAPVRIDFRVADATMKGWTADISDSRGDGFRLSVRPTAENDPFGDSSRDALSVAVSDRADGSKLAETIVSDGIDPFRGPNAWRLTRVGDRWSVRAGNREYRDVLEFSRVMEVPRMPEIASAANGGISVTLMQLDIESTQFADAMISDVDSLLSAVDGKRSEIKGVYSLFDHGYDDKYASLGGEYRVAVAPAEENGRYSMVYLGGARSYSDVWTPGMRKALLKATPFANIFDVEWTDAEGNLMRHDVQAEFDPLSETLLVNFPYQNSSLRFRKE